MGVATDLAAGTPVVVSDQVNLHPQITAGGVGAVVPMEVRALAQTLDRWLDEHPRDSYELIVAHTHAHSDHVAGDNQFNGRPSTTVVPADLDSVRSFFAFAGMADSIWRQRSSAALLGFST